MRHVIRNVIGNLVLAMRHVMHHVMRDVIDHVTQSWGLSGKVFQPLCGRAYRDRALHALVSAK